MMVAPLAGQQWQQREDAGVLGGSELQRRQRVRTPTRGANHAAEVPDRCEGGVERRPSGGVEHDVEAATACRNRHAS